MFGSELEATMSAQLDSHVYVKWIVAPEIEDEWQHAGCCVALRPDDAQPPVVDDEDDWWPGRCIV